MCFRYLANTHARQDCRAPIKCRACLHWAHIQVNCPVYQLTSSNSATATEANKGKRVLEQPSLFNAHSGPGPSKPLVFNSFSDWAATHLRPAAAPCLQQTMPWVLSAKTMTSGSPGVWPQLSANGREKVNLDLNLNLAPSASPGNQYITT